MLQSFLFRETGVGRGERIQRHREGDWEKQRHTGQKPGSLRAGGGGQTAYVGAQAPGCNSRRSEVKREKRKGEGETVRGEDGPEVLNIFVASDSSRPRAAYRPRSAPVESAGVLGYNSGPRVAAK